MYIPDLPKVLYGRSIVHLDKSSFTLDTSGVAGFFGGAEAASAMATVHICSYRQMWGWYNTPGSYEIAKRYGLLTRFGFLFGGGHADPAELLSVFELDGRKGPMFLRVHSGDIIPATDHLAAVFMRICTPPGRFKPQEEEPPRGGRQPVRVTIAELNSCPGDHLVPRRIHVPHSRTFAAIPIVVSVGACIMCGVVQDWYTFSLILLGIIANGLTCLVIGSIKLGFWRPRLAAEPEQEKQTHTQLQRVSGILITPDDVILLKGREDAAMAVARGKFELDRGGCAHTLIGLCSILLLIQFFAQLVLIPQGSLFGQIMFVTSLGASWCYNLWLCSIDKMEVQQLILRETLLELKEEDVWRYRLDNWPAMVTFVLLTLVLEDDEINDPERELQTVLNTLVEDASDVWEIWKSVILKRLPKSRESKSLVSQKDLDALASSLDEAKDLEISKRADGSFSWADRVKLDALLEEARSGIDWYKKRNRFLRSLVEHDHDTPFHEILKS